MLCEPENIYYELMIEDIEEWQGVRKRKRKKRNKKKMQKAENKKTDKKRKAG
ncbi:MAG: hypothetical protein IJ733_07765 [Lachnospiraceae bacterium]|nr:hypothetical protein [Lachnospiraceae bacterium]